MNPKPVPRRFLAPLVAIALVLTVAMAVVFLVAKALGKMGDATGQSILDAVAFGIALLWIIDVICLVLALGVNSLFDSPDEKRG